MLTVGVARYTRFLLRTVVAPPSRCLAASLHTCRCGAPALAAGRGGAVQPPGNAGVSTTRARSGHIRSLATRSLHTAPAHDAASSSGPARDAAADAQTTRGRSSRRSSVAGTTPAAQPRLNSLPRRSSASRTASPASKLSSSASGGGGTSAAKRSDGLPARSTSARSVSPSRTGSRTAASPRHPPAPPPWAKSTLRRSSSSARHPEPFPDHPYKGTHLEHKRSPTSRSRAITHAQAMLTKAERARQRANDPNRFSRRDPLEEVTAQMTEKAQLKPLSSAQIPMTVVMAPGDSHPRVPSPSRLASGDSAPLLAQLDAQPWPKLGAIPKLASGLADTLKVRGVLKIGEDKTKVDREAKIVKALAEIPRLYEPAKKEENPIAPPAWSSGFATDFEHITHPHLVDLSSLPGFVTSSRDGLLLRLAREQGCNVMGSTSSTTKILTHFIFSLSGFMPIQTDGILSPEFNSLPSRATSAERAPAIVVWRKRREGAEQMKDAESEEQWVEMQRKYAADSSVDVTLPPIPRMSVTAGRPVVIPSSRTVFDQLPYVWAIDGEASWSNPQNRILMELGHSLEAFFTHEPEVFRRRFVQSLNSLNARKRSEVQAKKFLVSAREVAQREAKWTAMRAAGTPEDDIQSRISRSNELDLERQRRREEHWMRFRQNQKEAEEKEAQEKGEEGKAGVENAEEEDDVDAEEDADDVDEKAVESTLKSVSTPPTLQPEVNLAQWAQDELRLRDQTDPSVFHPDRELAEFLPSVPQDAPPKAAAAATAAETSSQSIDDIISQTLRESMTTRTPVAEPEKQEVEANKSVPDAQGLETANAATVIAASDGVPIDFPTTLAQDAQTPSADELGASQTAAPAIAPRESPSTLHFAASTDSASADTSASSSAQPPPPAEPLALFSPDDAVRDSYVFVKMGRIMFRSQLDCWAPELRTRAELQPFVAKDEKPTTADVKDETAIVATDSSSSEITLPSWPGWELGGLVFDLKTRAVLPIRLFCRRYSDLLDYNLEYSRGLMYSFEREYYDMQRSAFLKFSLQCRIGRMGGVLIGYHNTTRLYGYHYVSIKEMDEALFGHTLLGEWMFENATKLFHEYLAADEHQEGSILNIMERENRNNWRRRKSMRAERLRLEAEEAKKLEQERTGKDDEDAKNEDQFERFKQFEAAKEAGPEALAAFEAAHPAALETVEAAKAVEDVETADSVEDDEDTFSPPPPLQTLKYTVVTAERSSEHITFFVEMLPLSAEEDDPQKDLPWTERYTSGRRVDSMPNYLIRSQLKRLRLVSTGERREIVSRLESALAPKPLQELPHPSVFLNLARQNLIHKFVIKVQLVEKAAGDASSSVDASRGRPIPREELPTLLAKWAKEYRRRDEAEMEKRQGGADAVGQEVVQELLEQRGAGARGAPLSPSSVSIGPSHLLSLSTSLTHVSVSRGNITPEELAQDYRRNLVLARVGDDQDQADGDMVRALQMTLESLVDSRARHDALAQAKQEEKEKARQREMERRRVRGEEIDAEGEGEEAEDLETTNAADLLASEVLMGAADRVVHGPKTKKEALAAAATASPKSMQSGTASGRSSSLPSMRSLQAYTQMRHTIREELAKLTPEAPKVTMAKPTTRHEKKHEHKLKRQLTTVLSEIKAADAVATNDAPTPTVPSAATGSDPSFDFLSMVPPPKVVLPKPKISFRTSRSEILAGKATSASLDRKQQTANANTNSKQRSEQEQQPSNLFHSKVASKKERILEELDRMEGRKERSRKAWARAHTPTPEVVPQADARVKTSLEQEIALLDSVDLETDNKRSTMAQSTRAHQSTKKSHKHKMEPLQLWQQTDATSQADEGNIASSASDNLTVEQAVEQLFNDASVRWSSHQPAANIPAAKRLPLPVPPPFVSQPTPAVETVESTTVDSAAAAPVESFAEFLPPLPPSAVPAAWKPSFSFPLRKPALAPEVPTLSSIVQHGVAAAAAKEDVPTSKSPRRDVARAAQPPQVVGDVSAHPNAEKVARKKRSEPKEQRKVPQRPASSDPSVPTRPRREAPPVVQRPRHSTASVGMPVSDIASEMAELRRAFNKQAKMVARLVAVQQAAIAPTARGRSRAVRRAASAPPAPPAPAEAVRGRGGRSRSPK